MKATQKRSALRLIHGRHIGGDLRIKDALGVVPRECAAGATDTQALQQAIPRKDWADMHGMTRIRARRWRVREGLDNGGSGRRVGGQRHGGKGRWCTDGDGSAGSCEDGIHTLTASSGNGRVRDRGIRRGLAVFFATIGTTVTAFAGARSIGAAALHSGGATRRFRSHGYWSNGRGAFMMVSSPSRQGYKNACTRSRKRKSCRGGQRVASKHYAGGGDCRAGHGANA